MIVDLLTTRLLDLLFELHDMPPIIGGGLGLYHKQRYRQSQGAQLLFADMPPPRATRDIDMFLRAEVITDVAATERVREVLKKLAYSPVPGKEYWQWKHGMQEREVIVDLLIGPLGAQRGQVRIKPPRVMPARKGLGLHAHETNEAAGLETHAVAIVVAGVRSDGEAWQTQVLVPHAFTYLIMKLHALRDRINREDSDFGRHHALDLFRTIAMLDRQEYDEALRLKEYLAYEDGVEEARRLVHTLFADDKSPGCLRLREHALFKGFAGKLPDFLAVLAEIHPPVAGGP